MSGGVPSGALGLSVVVLLYSFLCLFLGLLLFYLGWSHGSSSSYVSLIAVFSSVACVASITQQIHYATDWVAIKVAEHAAKERDLRSPALVVTGAAQGLDLGLFWVQFATYNINSLLVLFWAASLFQGTWQLRLPAKMKSLSSHLETAAKLFALFFPALLLGIAQVKGISSHALSYLLLCNLSLCISLLIGGILLILTLYKFITLKKRFASIRGSSGNSRQEDLRMRRRDKWIIIRFSIAFIILAVFEIAIISFEALQYGANQSAIQVHTTTLELHATLIELAQFVPGVTPPLVAFLVWGTTAAYWQEIKVLFSCCKGGMRNSPSEVLRKEASKLNFERLSNKSEQKVFSTIELRDLGGLEGGRREERS